MSDELASYLSAEIAKLGLPNTKFKHPAKKIDELELLQHSIEFNKSHGRLGPFESHILRQEAEEIKEIYVRQLNN